MIVAEVQPEQTGWIWWNPTKISLLLWHAKIRQQDLKRHHAAQVWKKESPVTEGDRSQLGSVVGGLAWVARQARPDLSYKVPKLQSWCNNANYQRLSKATSGPWTGIYTDQLQPTGRAWCLPWYLTHHGAMRQNTARKTTETQRSKGTHNHFGKPRFNFRENKKTSFHIYIYI